MNVHTSSNSRTDMLLRHLDLMASHLESMRGGGEEDTEAEEEGEGRGAAPEEAVVDDVGRLALPPLLPLLLLLLLLPLTV